MKTFRILPVIALLAGCADGVAIEGNLLEADDAAQVWIEGTEIAGPIDAGAFRLEGVSGDTIDLLFGADGEAEGRMRLLGLPGGGALSLHDVWIDDEIAFPSAVTLSGGRTVSINGMRMAGADRLGDAVDAAGTVLAVDDGGERIIIRPVDDGLPDLRVLVGEETVRTEDGDPVRASRLSFGDSVHVRGTVDGGYVMATEVTVSRGAAAGLAAREAEERDSRERDNNEFRVEVRPDNDRDDRDNRDDDDDRGRGNDARESERRGPPIRDGWPGRGRGRD